MQIGGILQSAVWQLAGFSILLVLVLWKIRDRAQIRREIDLRLVARNSTEEMERGQARESARNQVLEMLVSNEPLGLLLDAIARLVRDQAGGARCIILLKSKGADERVWSREGDFSVAASPGVPEPWLRALQRPRSVPVEVWRHPREFSDPKTDSRWRVFIGALSAQGPAETVPPGMTPLVIRSVPIGDSEASLGAILLVYTEPPGSEPWNKLLTVVAGLAQIAIHHRRYCDEIDFQAHHDALTGLPNRILLDRRLEDGIIEARLLDHRLAVCYLGFDNFKQINDRFSHRAGDEFLAEVATRITAVVGPDDTVARVGGDEFVVLLANPGNTAAAADHAARILEVIRKPMTVNGQDLMATASIGVSVFPSDGQESADLQRQADAAMYYAKSLGKNRVQIFSDNIETLDGVRIEQDLRHGLQRGWFKVYYQPKFTAEGRLAGAEALLRLNHPRHGQIPPGTFIPIAEATGLVIPIGAWVIAEVCRQIAEWRRRARIPLVVAVNVSAIQMSRPDFAGSVEKCLAAHAVPPSCLELEVTESMVIGAESEAHRQMQLLRAIGILISIDDFGTGFSSLSYLHRLQIDAIKLDRSFSQTIATDVAAQRLVRAVIGVARGLGLDVIAEGVETEEQRVQLVAAGCPVMQGYLFARPGPPEALESLLAPDPAGDDLGRLYGALKPLAQSVASPH